MEGTRWITIGAHRDGEKSGKHAGRHILINGNGVIVGGAVPKSWHGKEIGEAVQKADKDLTNMYKGYSKSELEQIHQGYKESHGEMKKQLHDDVNGLAKWLRDQDVESNKSNNIVSRIRDIGRIHFGSNPEYHEDYREIHPGVKKAVGTQKSKQGMGIDVMADELGMHPDDLIDYLKAATPNNYKKIDDYHNEAKRQMGNDYHNRTRDIEEMGKHVRAIQAAMDHHDAKVDKEAHKIWAAFTPNAEKAIPGAQAAFDKGGVNGLMDHIVANSPKHYEALKTNMANKVKAKGDSVSDAEKRANEMLQAHRSSKREMAKTHYIHDTEAAKRLIQDVLDGFTPSEAWKRIENHIDLDGGEILNFIGALKQNAGKKWKKFLSKEAIQYIKANLGEDDNWIMKKNDNDTYYPSDRYAYKTNEKDPIYVPVNRIQTPFQTEEATNPDKVQENIKRMKAGEALQPIIIGYRNHVLHDGHHRLEAAKKMGYTHVPCVVGGRNDRRVKAAEKRYRRMWKSEKTVVKGGRVLIKSKLSPKLKSMVSRGEAHWVTIKQGPLEGRHLLINGPRPATGKQSKGEILAGHGIPSHVIQKITGATHANHLEHEQSDGPEGLKNAKKLAQDKRNHMEWMDKVTDHPSTNRAVREHMKATGKTARELFDQWNKPNDKEAENPSYNAGDKVHLGGGIHGIVNDTGKHGWYNVTEHQTGRYISGGRGPEDAVNSAKEEIGKKAQQWQDEINSELKGPFTHKDAERLNHLTHFPKSVKRLNDDYHGAVESETKSAKDKLSRYGVNEIPDHVQEALDRVAQAHEHVMKEGIRAREVAPPTSVTGRANYRGRPDKADTINRNAQDKLDKARYRLDKEIEKYSPKRAISSDEDDAVQQLQDKIDAAEKLQDAYKKINAIVRKKKLSNEEKINQIKSELGFKESTAQAALDLYEKHGFGIWPHSLTNNNANIKRMKQRVEQLKTQRSQSTSSHEFDGGIIHDNVDANRLQIFFHDKPDADMRAKMKSKGFRWAPSAEGPNGESGAWQRFRSPEATRKAHELVGSKVEKSFIDKIGRLLLKKKDKKPKIKHSKPSQGLSHELKSRVAAGDAHWVTIKEGPLEGRHILIGGPRPAAGEKSKGPILAGRGIPPHVIQKITGATHAEHLETEPHKEAPPEGTEERWSWWNDKFKKGHFTADEVREHFNWATNNKDKLHEMYMNQINNDPKLKRKRTNTKNEIANRAYDRHIQKLGYAASDSLQYNPFSDNGLEEGVKRVVDNLTDEDIEKHWGEKRAEFAAKKKAIDNPESLQELRQKRNMVGVDRMTDAEREKLDELEALEAKKNNAQPETKTVAPTSANIGGFDVTKTKHTKTGADLWVAKPKNRLERDEFNELHSKIKALGGYYSKYTKGFTFNEDPGDKLNGLLNDGAEVENHKASEDYKQGKAQNAAEKLRSVADNMQKQIDDKRADRLTNTARRASMAANAEADADRLAHIQKVMRNIADGIESGEATHLDGVTSRTHVETLENILKRAHWNNDQKNGIGYEKSRQTQPTKDDIKDLEYPKPYANISSLKYLMEGIEGKPGTKRAAQYLQRYIDDARRQDKHSFEFDHGSRAFDEIQKLVNIGKTDPKAKYYADSVNDGLIQSKRLQAMGIENDHQLRATLREYMNYRGSNAISKEEQERRKLRDMEQQSTRQGIAGFFPTPKGIANRMVEEADIKPGMKVLEPSAGKGNIADAIKQEHPGAHLDTVEYNHGLADILRHKGHNVVGDDFLQHKGEYDRIVMNPPFENGQDIDHVRHAFDMLKPGGKLVAIMSEGPFFNSRSKAADFREWLDHNGGHSEKLPEGAFKDSERSTGVNTRLVTIEKPRNTHKSMVTKDGRLLIKKKQKTIKMYHGTWGKIDKFTKREIKDYNTIGSWFTSDPKTAQNLYGPNLYEANVELKKPYQAETDDFDDFFFNEKLAKKYLNGKDFNNPDRDVMTKLLNNKKYMTEFKRDLEKRGYDAIMFKNSTIDKEDDGSEGRHTVYIVFRPENQVKDSKLISRKGKVKSK